ncbi:unnamed protein product [Heterobilharzia americana]|nr:unnamed protein product [Heterobilharzia americana]
MFLCKKSNNTTSYDGCIEVLQKAGLDGLLEKNHFTTALCLISRNGQGIATSAFSVWANQAGKIVNSVNGQTSTEFSLVLDQLYEAMDKHVGPFLDNEGVGLYYYQSRINHSCSPNAVIRFSGVNSQLSVVALTSINEGEEITISYLDQCLQSRGRHTRHKMNGALSVTSSEGECEDEEEEKNGCDNDDDDDIG